MGGRISLESFDDCVGGAGPQDDVPGMNGGDSPEPDAPSAAAPEPEIDHEAERIAALTRLAAALETVAAEQAALRAACQRQAATAFGQAAAAVLPALARAAFCAQVAETARTVAQNGRWPDLVVSVAEEQAQEIAEFLGRGRPPPALRIEPRPDIPPGEAEIAWDGGGAEIDAAAIAETTLAGYRRELDVLAQTGA
ncbi:MAG TPA: hypothetical protein VLA52_06655 [Thermohalobaculum sp.]|nr:hypothetical protein [Thermohalobaculum sp.]